jgi:hypothetical protein
LPVIYKRIVNGKVVFINPKKRLRGKIVVKHLDEDKAGTLSAHVAILALSSILMPWIVVILAYHTPPVEFGCRSRYLTAITILWTINNTITYYLHIKGDTSVTGNRYVHSMFATCGILVVTYFSFLVILGGKPELWSIMGESCLKKCY